ncbi:cysteine desulfurase [Sinorhizobium medicae]|nr:cysteine desulfurase [Sinorhizobium medicae]
MPLPIFLDGFSTTPIAPEARDALLLALTLPANAGSSHYAGERAANTVMAARTSVAKLVGAAPGEIIFTSGATEANNLAVFGVAQSAAGQDPKRQRIVVSSVEHKAVSAPAERLKQFGFDVVVAPVDRFGRVDLQATSSLIDEQTLLVCVMAANNETGVVQPVAEVTAIAHAHGALVHCDAAQAAGKIELDVVALEVDYLSLSGHKLYGPMGVGALYVSAIAPKLEPVQFGGGQQSGLRPGTEPVPLIAAFGAACDLAMAQMAADTAHGRESAEAFLHRLATHQIRFTRTTGEADVIPGSLSLMINALEAEDLVMSVSRQVSLSTGSACTSGQIIPSHVLKAMGKTDDEARSVFRLFFSRYTTPEEVELSADIIAAAVGKLTRATGRFAQ